MRVSRHVGATLLTVKSTECVKRDHQNKVKPILFFYFFYTGQQQKLSSEIKEYHVF